MRGYTSWLISQQVFCKLLFSTRHSSGALHHGTLSVQCFMCLKATVLHHASHSAEAVAADHSNSGLYQVGLAGSVGFDILGPRLVMFLGKRSDWDRAHKGAKIFVEEANYCFVYWLHTRVSRVHPPIHGFHIVEPIECGLKIFAKICICSEQPIFLSFSPK